MALAASNDFSPDASLIGNRSPFPNAVHQQPEHIIFDRTLLSSILNNFTKEDINELSFLILPSLPTEKASSLWSALVENTITIDSRARIRPSDVIVDLLFVGDDCTVTGALLIEALYYMKKFKVLRKLGYCKHRVKHDLDSREGTISKFWSFMYSILQDMDDIELFCLIDHLISDSHNQWSGFNMRQCDKWTPELFFWQMYNKKIFAENHLHVFYHPLQMISREDIKDRMRKYEASCLYYPIRSTNPYGIAVIINQVDFQKHKPPGGILENRIGSDVDKKSLIQVLKKFGFDVKEPYNDLRAEEIIQLALDLSVQDFSQYDVFMCCVLSHGRSGEVMGVDHQPVALAEFFQIFASSSTLKKIPKIFLVQACQNKLMDDDGGEPKPRSSENVRQDGPGVPDLLPTGYGDMLCAVSTIDTYVSYRSRSFGSMFIQSFVNNLNGYGSTEDLDTILKKVNNDVSRNLDYPQMPKYESTLRFKVQLRQAV